MRYLLIALALIGGYLIYFMPMYKKDRDLEAILHRGKNLDEYFKEIDRTINKTKNQKYQNLLLIKKSGGLIALSKYKEVVNLLKTFDMKDLKNLPKVYIVQYYSYQLFSLLMLEKHDEAERLYHATYGLLSEYKRQYSLKNLILNSFAAYEYYNGDINKSRHIFEEMLAHKSLIPIHRITSLYFLGLIDMKEENSPKAKERFEELLTVEHDNTYFEKMATKQLKSL